MNIDTEFNVGDSVCYLRNKMENEEYFCIDCAKQLECWGPDIKLDDPDLYIPINCIDYQEMNELFNL